MRVLGDGFDEGGEGLGVAVDIVGYDVAAFVDAVFEGVEVFEVFFFGGIEEGEVEFFRCFRNSFRGVAEDEGDVGEAGFFDVFLGKGEAFFEVGFNGVEVAAGLSEGGGEVEGAITVAGADFEDGFEVVFEDEFAKKFADFGGDVPVLVAGGFEFLEEVCDRIIHRLLLYE